MLKQVDLAELERELAGTSETTVLDASEAARWAVRQVVPRLLCRPATQDGAAAALAACDRAGASVIPWGGGTQQRLGFLPSRADVVLVTSGLARIVEYEPADLTVTVEAGIRFADLQSTLGKHGQWLALDPPLLPGATVGGLVATNVSGPRRLKDGGLRDLVIGTKVANVNGTVTKAGGHVVKNVTGYDLNKGHVGGMGTLGVLVEVSFKVAPRPETERSWFATFATPEAASEAIALLRRLPVPPTGLEIMKGRTAQSLGLSGPPGGWVVLGRASGFPPTVDRYLREFEAAARAAGAAQGETLSKKASTAVWQAYDTLAARLRWSPGALTCRLALPPATTASVCGLAASLSPEALLWGHAWGAVFWSVPDSSEAANPETVSSLRRLAADAHGALVVENWRDGLAGLDVWGAPGGPLAIMRAIKGQFDPNGTLNPGRFVGSI